MCTRSRAGGKLILSALVVLLMLLIPGDDLGSACVGDINRDGKVNVLDLGMLNAEMGRTNCRVEPCPSDLNGDGAVNSDDRDMLKSELGRNDCFTDGEEDEGGSLPGVSDESDVPEGTVTTAPVMDDLSAEQGQTERFRENGDGTVTDTATGLVWTEDANLSGDTMLYHQAINYIEEMNRGAVPNFGYTDWRMPTLEELRSLLDYTHYKREGHVLPSGHPFTNVKSLTFSSASGRTYLWRTQLSWFVSLYCRVVGHNTGSCFGYLWPVRGGT